MERTSLAVREPEEIIVPASPEKTLEAMKRFQKFKAMVLDKDDYVEIKTKDREGKELVRQYVKKSGWLKYAFACNISLQKLEERTEPNEDKTVYTYTYRAIAPNGRFADAVGAASTNEREYAHEDHDPRALGQTRAMNRAIANLVAGGEVSAEEVLPGKVKANFDEIVTVLVDEINGGLVMVDDKIDAVEVTLVKSLPADKFNSIAQTLKDYGAEYKAQDGRRFWRLPKT